MQTEQTPAQDFVDSMGTFTKSPVCVHTAPTASYDIGVQPTKTSLGFFGKRKTNLSMRQEVLCFLLLPADEPKHLLFSSCWWLPSSGSWAVDSTRRPSRQDLQCSALQSLSGFADLSLITAATKRATGGKFAESIPVFTAEPPERL